MAFMLSLMTQERHLLSEEVDYIQAKGVEGEFGVLTGHTPFLTLLDIGELLVRNKESLYSYFVAGGVVEVLPDRVTVLADTIERAEEIDGKRAEEARQNAIEALKQPISPESRLGFEQVLKREGVRLKILSRRQSARHPGSLEE
ncbi:ATP synthase F1 subunit epsilon [Leptospirillum ferriphilum]|jgi:F-type H+-transporting ATPase subunit epsilon|uniref:ATP synthase epsilon chain n=2 Tax=Leptospirillum TaxID=179 RepID=A0A094X8H6_9BACT|nr:ATP synthase F1 subunit epsilon [Leptospirillum ferriphilum]EDZ39765.1 MAG: ATP synthase F1, epsilon subunit [Leptospirillum sp. Group II '5-way CG']KGA94849.1 ATP synthase epsilon chain [Leptospirillum ferriphilum]